MFIYVLLSNKETVAVNINQISTIKTERVDSETSYTLITTVGGQEIKATQSRDEIDEMIAKAREHDAQAFAEIIGNQLGRVMSMHRMMV